jgi:hypothetical protein
MINQRYLPAILAFSMSLGLGACKTLFTESIRNTIQSSHLDRIEQVQFYNDRDIEIEYKTSSASDKIEGGKVKFIAGFYYYTIKFPKNTKAIAKHLDNNRLKVYFESGADRYLVFGDAADDSDPYYQLYGTNESGDFIVNFESKEFKVVKGDDALLKIKKKYKESSRKKTRKVKGVKVK